MNRVIISQSKLRIFGKQLEESPRQRPFWIKVVQLEIFYLWLFYKHWFLQDNGVFIKKNKVRQTKYFKFSRDAEDEGNNSAESTSHVIAADPIPGSSSVGSGTSQSPSVPVADNTLYRYVITIFCSDGSIGAEPHEGSIN